MNAREAIDALASAFPDIAIRHDRVLETPRLFMAVLEEPILDTGLLIDKVTGEVVNGNPIDYFAELDNMKVVRVSGATQ